MRWLSRSFDRRLNALDVRSILTERPVRRNSFHTANRSLERTHIAYNELERSSSGRMVYAIMLLAASSSLLIPSKPATEATSTFNGRRSLLLGGFAAFASGTAASASTPDNLSSILDRAEKGSLRATPVLMRARADKLIEPKDVSTCKQITSLIEVDSEVLYEMLPSFRNYVKSKTPSEDDMDYAVKKILKSMLEDEDKAKGRIQKQLNGLSELRSERGCP